MLMLFVTIQTWFAARLGAERERGATMVEYGLLLALIAVVALVGARQLGIRLNNVFTGISF